MKTFVKLITMYKKIYLFLFCFGTITPVNSNAQTVEEIITNHFKATGSEKLLDVQTIITRGMLTQAGSEIPIVTYNKRPNKVKIEGLFQDVKFVEAFDGENGWTYNIFRGITKPVPLEQEYLEVLKDRADIDGLLYNYADKGYEIILLDPVNEGEIIFNVLLLTKPDKSTATYFIDSKTSVVIKIVSNIIINGVASEVENIFSDYRYVDEILFPFSIDVKSGGQLILEYNYSTVVLNKEIDDSIFEMPDSN